LSERQFLEPAAKQRTADVIRAIETETAVEVVVAVRRAAAHHFGTSAAFGLACAAAAFGVMWFSPQAYDVRTMPLDAALAFAFGAAFTSSVASVRRLLTPARFRRASAEAAARVTFTALGIEKTRGRSGLLVYVPLFERTPVLVPDAGIPEALRSGALASLRAALATAVERADFEAFLSALARLGPACSAALPRQADDENELCDDVA
jgi:putative membrane protein